MKNVIITCMTISAYRTCVEAEGIKETDKPVRERITSVSRKSGEARFLIHKNAPFELSELRMEV